MNKAKQREIYEFRARGLAREKSVWYINNNENERNKWIDENWMDFLTDKEAELF